MTAIFMLTIVSLMQSERCHVRSSNLLVTWAFEDVDCSVAAACRLFLKCIFLNLQYCVNCALKVRFVVGSSVVLMIDLI